MTPADGDTKTGKLLREYLTCAETHLDPHTSHLLFSANRWEMAEQIKQWLSAGRNVICDRYVASGRAYSLALGLDRDWVMKSDKGLPLPDLTVYLKVGDDDVARRAGYGDEKYETAEFQRRVAAHFETLLGEDDTVCKVDASQGIDEVARRVHSMIVSKK